MRPTILILFDELTCYNNLPPYITKNLKGYQLFKKKCIEFNNIQTSRQQCTPSRSNIMTGIYDTSCQDNMEFNYQYDYFPTLPTNLDTMGKIYKKNNYNVTAYYGKQHLDSKFGIGLYSKPTFNTATIDTMKIYGYDHFNLFGDPYYHPSHGLLSDNQVISYELPPNSQIYDYIDIEQGTKYSGVIPFLKARLIDKKLYYLECHISNPHDTNHFIQNLNQKPGGIMNQFPVPFIDLQLKEDSVPNPYYFNELNQYAVPTHHNLLENYFEPNYDSYKLNKFILPYLTSYELDYATCPKINSLNPLMVGTYYAIQFNMTISDSQKDIKDWKNFLNNYYGLLFEADSYLEKLYYFFELNGIFDTSNIIITSDHGDLLSSHGLKQKQLPFKECSNVACLIYSPDLSNDLIGKSSDLYGSLVDILPTQLVLNNLYSETRFDGKPLLVWSGNKLVLNVEEHLHYIPVNIVNSTMYALNYFFYLLWHKQNYNSELLTSNPSNMFEFQSSFVSIITHIDGYTYKFGRYYSIYSTILYQLFMDQERNNFNKLHFIEYIETNTSIISKKSTIKYIMDKFPKLFTFQTGLNIINNDFGEYNIYLYYTYYAFIANTLNSFYDFSYFIPGSMSDWNTNQNLNIFTYFLYDINSDPSESFNLMDPKNINYISDELKNKFNDILNLSLQEKNCFQLKTILADKTFLQLSNILYILGGFINDESDDLKLQILGTLNGLSGLDTVISYSTKIIFNDYINLSLNSINLPDIINPYNLYDCVENIYYVGEYKYIKFINSNMPYFMHFVMSKGLPNLFDKKFVIESNNLLPLLNVFKIIKTIEHSL